MTLDKETRKAMTAAIMRATMEAQEVYSEQWLTGEQLCAEVGFFTKEWLKRYGQTLPRERVRVILPDGKEHQTAWCYPKKKILRMVAEGELRAVRV